MEQKSIRTLGKHGLFLQKRFPNRNHSISYAIAVIDEFVTVPLNQDQFDALVSLISDVGKEIFVSSMALKNINSKEFSQVWVDIGSIGLKHGNIFQRRVEGVVFKGTFCGHI
jgi:GH24 family phage-related lysozyme (muramidase)